MSNKLKHNIFYHLWWHLSMSHPYSCIWYHNMKFCNYFI